MKTCACGCGLAVAENRTWRSGHNAPRKHRGPREELFWRHVDKDGRNGCWLWTGFRRGGYGRFWNGERMEDAHRWAYRTFVAPITPELDIDHLCRTKACVRPDHLEAVTHQENVRRGLTGDLKTHCFSGRHEWNDENIAVRNTGVRLCRPCLQERIKRQTEVARQRRLARKAAEDGLGYVVVPELPGREPIR